MTSPLDIVLRGARTVLLGNGTSKFALILFELLIARFLNATEFGYYAIAIAVTQIVSNFSIMGLNFGVVQYLSIYQEQGDLRKQKSALFFTLLCVGGLSLILALGLALGARPLAEMAFDKPDLALVFLCAAPLVFLDAVSWVTAASFRGLRQYRQNLFAYDLTKNMLCLIGVPAVLVVGGHAASMLLLCAAGSATGLVYGIVTLARQGLLPKSKAEIDMAVLPDLWNFSKLLFVWNMLQVLSVRLFIVLAGVLLTAAETGALAVATRLTLCFIFFQNAANAPTQTEFAKFFHYKDKDASRSLYQTISQGLLGIVAVPALILLIDPQFIVRLFGPEYATYGWVVWPLLLAHFINVVTGPAGQILMAYEKQKTIMVLTLCDILMQFAIVVPLMYFHGIVSAVLGEAARLLIFLSLRLWIIHRDIGVHPFGQSYARLSFLFTAVLASGLALSLSGQEYFIALGYSVLFYGIGATWVIATDPHMLGQIKTLLSRAAPK